MAESTMQSMMAEAPMEAVMAKPTMAESTMEAAVKPPMSSPGEPTTPSAVKASGISRPDWEPGDNAKAEYHRYSQSEKPRLPFRIHRRCLFIALPLFDMAFRILLVLIEDTPAGGQEVPQPEPLVWVSQ